MAQKDRDDSCCAPEETSSCCKIEAIVSVDDRGQMVLPKEIRDKAKIRPGDKLAAIVEKPERPEDYIRDGRLWVSMNLYRFTPHIFDACRRIKPDPVRGELELTAAVAILARVMGDLP